MEAIILAGGYGTRLREVVSDLPKPMAPVAGKPFLEILLLSLAKQGFTRIILSLGYMADKVVAYFGNSFSGIELVYEIESSPLGTGGAISRALLQCHDEFIFVFNGDTYMQLDVGAIVKQWMQNKNPLIVAREVDDVSRYGCLEITNGRVTSLLEKGKTGAGVINAGCYVFPRDIFSEKYLNKSFSLETDFFANELNSRIFDLYVAHGDFIDIGIPADYLRAQTYLKHSI